MLAKLGCFWYGFYSVGEQCRSNFVLAGHLQEAAAKAAEGMAFHSAGLNLLSVDAGAVKRAVPSNLTKRRQACYSY
jgi:hypothetical protein